VKNEMTRDSQIYSKVPEVTLGFWIIKILATTLGETGGDSESGRSAGVRLPETARRPLVAGTGQSATVAH